MIRKNGCDSTVRYFLNFYEINTTIVSADHTLTAYNDPEYKYQWFDCNTNKDIQGANDHIFSPPYSGNFGVRLKHSNGCEAQSECYFVSPVYVNEISSSAITISPNPSNGQVRIVNKSGKKISKIRIVNAAGEKIKEYTNPSDELKVNLFHEGIYLIIIDIDNQSIVKKIICIRD